MAALTAGGGAESRARRVHRTFGVVLTIDVFCTLAITYPTAPKTCSKLFTKYRSKQASEWKPKFQKAIDRLLHKPEDHSGNPTLPLSAGRTTHKRASTLHCAARLSQPRRLPTRRATESTLLATRRPATRSRKARCTRGNQKSRTAFSTLH